MLEFLLSPIGIAVVCYAYYETRMKGQLILALPNERLSAAVHEYVLSNMQYIDEAADYGIRRGAIDEGELARFIREQMEQSQFPRMKLYDLCRSVTNKLENSAETAERLVASNVRTSFNDVAKEYDTRRKRWI